MVGLSQLPMLSRLSDLDHDEGSRKNHSVHSRERASRTRKRDEENTRRETREHGRNGLSLSHYLSLL